jgi:hypothetical protein
LQVRSLVILLKQLKAAAFGQFAFMKMSRQHMLLTIVKTIERTILMHLQMVAPYWLTIM